MPPHNQVQLIADVRQSMPLVETHRSAPRVARAASDRRPGDGPGYPCSDPSGPGWPRMPR